MIPKNHPIVNRSPAPYSKQDLAGTGKKQRADPNAWTLPGRPVLKCVNVGNMHLLWQM